MVNLTTPAPGAGRGGGRGRGSYSSAVGEPGAGVPIPSARRRRSRERPAASNTSGCAGNDTATPGSRAGPAAAVNDFRQVKSRPSPFPTNAAAQGSGGLWRPSGVVYAVSADGMFRTLGLVSGKDVRRPAPFVPAGARFSDLIAVNDRVYAATSHGCGGAADGIWAIDIASDTQARCVSWKTNGGSSPRVCRLRHQRHRYRGDWPRHRHGRGLRERDRRARSEDARREGLVQAARCRVRCAARACFRSLARTSSPSRPRTGAFCCSTPPHSAARIMTRRSLRRRRLPAAPRRSRRSHRRCGRSAQRSPPQPGPRLLLHPRRCQPAGARWLLIPVAGPLPASLGAAGNGAVSSGAILGVKLAHQDGKFSVQPAWISQNIAAPLTPIVVNGVAFAASGPSNAPAGLYALHGATGQTLWQSEKTITSPLSGRSFWVGSGHVFVGTRDGTVYAFGFAMERK